MLTTILIATLICLIFLLYRNRKQRQAIFKLLGVPGPDPHWWYGNLHQMDRDNEIPQLLKWTREYGKIFGYFEGPTPILCVSDMDFLQEVFIKKFAHFSARKKLYLQPDVEKSERGVHILNAKGERWKRLRMTVNPSFSSGKLKQIYPMIGKKTLIMLDQMKQAAVSNQPVDMKPFFEGLTLDVMAESAFGMQVDAQREPDQPVLNACRKTFEQTNPGKILHLPRFIPELRIPLWSIFTFLSDWVKSLKPSIIITDGLAGMVNMRRKDSSFCRKDLLQLLLDAESGDEASAQNLEISLDKEDTEEGNSKTASHKTPKKLTTTELISMCMVLMLAGYETTSTSLTFCAYLLATNPDKQKKLFEEIDSNFSDCSDMDYAKVTKLPYLDMVFKETLRMYPIAYSVINRECTSPCIIQGIEIPVGMTIQAQVECVHKDLGAWGPVDPEQFEPERFSAESSASRHPMAFMAFGSGPRNCVGMRFAMMEFKLAVARIIKKFELVQCDKTEVPVPTHVRATLQPSHSVFLTLRER